MILATRLARKRSASTRMRAHSRGLMLTRRSKRHGSGLQTAFEEKTDFFLFVTDLPSGHSAFYKQQGARHKTQEEEVSHVFTRSAAAYMG